MTTVITYGTFDLLHEGHIRLLRRAKELGDKLIVGVTSDSYDVQRGKLNVSQSLVERISNVKETGLADLILVEEYDGQKIHDIEKFEVDIFAIGSDWRGKFDYLNEYCKVVYLERTRGISSTMLRNDKSGILSIGIVGSGRIARRFVSESRRVSGVHIGGVYSIDLSSALAMAEEFELTGVSSTYQDLLNNVDAIYIASPHSTHYEYALTAIEAGKHVLCETPMVLRASEAKTLHILAIQNDVILLEAAKTAFLPGFRRMLELAKSGTIGTIRSVDATFTKLVRGGREFCKEDGGAISEMATYPLLAIEKILGQHYDKLTAEIIRDEETNVDVFSRINFRYPGAIATATVGIGVKSEGALIISGTKGYLYVPAPWWLTRGFETRYEDANLNRTYFYPYQGEGLRYEIAEFARMIRNRKTSTFKWRPTESQWVADVIEKTRMMS